MFRSLLLAMLACVLLIGVSPAQADPAGPARPSTTDVHQMFRSAPTPNELMADIGRGGGREGARQAAPDSLDLDLSFDGLTHAAVGRNVRMNSRQGPLPIGLLGRSETAIATDPSGQHLVSGWNDAQGFCGPPFGAPCPAPPVPGLSGLAYSSTGGATWTDGGTPAPIPLDGTSIITRGDPWLDTGGPGQMTFYYANLGMALDFSTGGLTVHRGQFDAGNFAFNHSVFIEPAAGDFLDKEALAAGKTPGMQNEVAISVTNFKEVAGIPEFGFGQIEVYVSHDGGTTFTGPSIVQKDETRGVVQNYGVLNQGSAPAYGPNGELYVVWERGFLSPLAGMDMLGAWPQIVIARSDDGGATFGQRRVVSDIASGAFFPPAGYNRGTTNDFPRICAATHNGDPHRGRVYVAYQDARAANGGPQSETGGFGNADTDVYVRYSDDEGWTWSAPTLVNSTAADGKIQFWPVITCNRSGGAVDVTYHEQDMGTGLVSVMYAHSSNGGATFSTPIAVTNTPTNWATATSNITPNFGDYIAHVASENKVHVTWADGRTGVPDAYYATLEP